MGFEKLILVRLLRVVDSPTGSSDAAHSYCQPSVMMLRWTEIWQEEESNGKADLLNWHDRGCPTCHLATHPDRVSETLNKQLNILVVVFQFPFIALTFDCIFRFLVNVQLTFSGFGCTLTRTRMETQRGVVIDRLVESLDVYT